jgi:hypothetical protein
MNFIFEWTSSVENFENTYYFLYNNYLRYQQHYIRRHKKGVYFCLLRY